MECACDGSVLLKNWRAPEPEQPFVTGLKVSNSLTGTKVPFIPNKGNIVNWYGCGPTVYDSAHMGHARNYVSFDIMRRIMENYFGYKVNMCMNITDIDDKIIARANELNIPFDQLSRYWENDFFLEMRKLNCRLPDVITRVSEFVPEILTFIQGIIDHGFAYESKGSVYFDTTAFRASEKHIYGRMEPWSVNDEARVLEGEGALGVVTEKRCPLDFALWKKSKAGEPSWASPWGEGRPGWHIECSAMASDVLGFPLDLHSGGIDLRFPHHDNELAQTEANYDRPQWVNYFLHSGHLHIKGLKMSKSLKNFITIKAILERYPARVVRILSLIHRWDQPMNYDPDGSSMKEPLELDRVFTHFFENLTQVLRKNLKSDPDLTDASSLDMKDLLGLNAPQKWGEDERRLQKVWEAAEIEIHEALCDNFNTPLVVTKLQDIMGEVNVYLRNKEKKGETIRGPLLAKVGKYCFDLLRMFGVVREDEQTFAYTGAATLNDEKFASLMDVVGEFRHQMREMSRALLKSPESAKEAATQLLKLSDTFRDNALVDLGIRLEDKGDRGFIWKQSTREELMKERERRHAEEESSRIAKEERQKELAQAKAKKEAEARIPPNEFFKVTRGAEFGSYDDEGMPLKLADGSDISKSQRDKMRKQLDKHKSVHDKALSTASSQ